MISLGELIIYGIKDNCSFFGNVFGICRQCIVGLKHNGIGTLIVFFDEVIAVDDGLKEELVSVVDIQLSLLQNYLSERGIMLEVSQEAKLYIVEQCYDPALGARPIRRALQQYIEDPIAEGLLVGEFSDFSTITVDVLEGKLDFKSETLPSA